jgi:3-dehydroquinate dehydratase-2
MKILVIHGPNLNLLGQREPDLYGCKSLQDINQILFERARELEIKLETFQTNSESKIVDKIQEVKDSVDGILINPGGFTHTSVSIRDALLATGIPFVEVHLSNIYGRETFRRHSFLSDIAMGVVCGFGADSYLIGLDGLVRRLSSQKKAEG